MNRNLHVHIPTPGDHYSPKTGSAVITVIREMTRCHLAAGGKAQVLVAPGTWDGFDDGLRREVRFRRLGTPSAAAKIFDRTIGGVLGRRMISGLPYRDAADALGRDFEGIVFVHNEPSGIEIIARQCPIAKVCLWVHNDLFRTYTRRQSRRVLRYAYRIICVSNFIANTIRSKAGVNTKIVTVLNGVDTEKFVPANPPPMNDPPVILFLGRMVPEKGPDILLRAAFGLKKGGLRFNLRLVGSQNFNAADRLTPYECELRRLASDFGENVEFRPFRPRNEVVHEYQAADILCVPSNWDDPCPLTVLEGIACGVAVVASDRGGIPEIGGEAAAYFKAADFADLSRVLSQLLGDAAQRQNAAHRARHAGEMMSWNLRYANLVAVTTETTQNLGAR